MVAATAAYSYAILAQYLRFRLLFTSSLINFTTLTHAQPQTHDKAFVHPLKASRLCERIPQIGSGSSNAHLESVHMEHHPLPDGDTVKTLHDTPQSYLQAISRQYVTMASPSPRRSEKDLMQQQWVATVPTPMSHTSRSVGSQLQRRAAPGAEGAPHYSLPPGGVYPSHAWRQHPSARAGLEGSAALEGEISRRHPSLHPTSPRGRKETLEQSIALPPTPSPYPGYHLGDLSPMLASSFSLSYTYQALPAPHGLAYSQPVCQLSSGGLPGLSSFPSALSRSAASAFNVVSSTLNEIVQCNLEDFFSGAGASVELVGQSNGSFGKNLDDDATAAQEIERASSTPAHETASRASCSLYALPQSAGYMPGYALPNVQHALGHAYLDAPAQPEDCAKSHQAPSAPVSQSLFASISQLRSSRSRSRDRQVERTQRDVCAPIPFTSSSLPDAFSSLSTAKPYHQTFADACGDSFSLEPAAAMDDPCDAKLHGSDPNASLHTRGNSDLPNSSGQLATPTRGRRKSIHTCEECGFSCRDSANIIRHRRRHGTHRPYACVTCGKGFINSSNRRKHEKKCRDSRQDPQ
jgi:hypothetical protein